MNVCQKRRDAMTRIFVRLLLPALVCVAWNCSNSPTSGRAPTVEELAGTWIVTQGSQHTTYVYKGIIFGDTLDSSATRDSTFYYSDSSRTYIFHADSTYRARGAMPGSILPLADTGNWLLAGSSLTLYSNSGDTTSGTVGISGSMLSFTTVTSGALVGGAFSMAYTVITTIYGIKRQ
jgi:hypothetical protein